MSVSVSLSLYLSLCWSMASPYDKLSESILFVWSQMSYSGEKVGCHDCGQRKSDNRRNSRQIRNHFLGCQTDIVSFALLVDLFEEGWGRVLAGSYLCHLVFPIDMSDVCCDNCALLILIDIPETYM